jgi:hypothetical protein
MPSPAADGELTANRITKLTDNDEGSEALSLPLSFSLAASVPRSVI